VGNFAFLYPILTAASLSQSAWLARMWLPGWRL
jgi:dolichyl-phosphate-mannose--protein O-mannosyl transferase